MISKLRQFGARRAITAVLAIGLVGVVAVPAINAASSVIAPAAPTADNSAATAAGGAGAGQVDEAALTPAAVRLGAGLLNRVVRGDLTLRAKGGTYVQIHYERGKISAVSSTSITITGPDGKGATFAVTATTRIRSGGKVVAIGDLTMGQTAVVLGTGSAGSYNALLIRGIVPRPATNGSAPAPAATTTP